MQKTVLIYFILLSISAIYSQITKEERKNLLKEIYKKLKINEERNILYRSVEYEENSKNNYDIDKIKEIIEKYDFPETYNFIEDVNPPVHIKNQESCGCCWAFASSTALAYRYYKQGINVNLSPQYLLSCFSGDCEEGGYLIDTEFLLVKEGTITEGCMPYSSADGKTIEECPSTCKNDEEFIKYRSKNPYSTTFDFDNNYYDVVTIIMDQLVTYGPVVSNILVYEDFFPEISSEDCVNKIYKYDGESEFSAAHAVVIVGYGYQDNKYYWIIQNSWGEEFCDNGFAKIEFGQINIENVGFSEPYIEEEDITPNKEISVTLTLNEDCKYTYITYDENYEDSFELNFKGKNYNFYYQCNKAPFKDEKKGICNFNLDSFNNNEVGNYVYNDYKPIHKNNIFNINFATDADKQFYYYQYDTVDNLFYSNFYVSEKGSHISLYYESNSENQHIPNIYPNKNHKDKIKNCEIINLNELDLIHCIISEDELQIFNSDDNEVNNLPLAYDTLCGQKFEMSISVLKLDKTKYPVIRVIKLQFPNSNYFRYNVNLTLIANIEGSVSEYNEENYFYLFIRIKTGKNIKEEMIQCIIPSDLKIQNNYELTCYFYYDDSDEKISYESVELAPFYFPEEDSSPFEVIINENKEMPTSNNLRFYKISFSLILFIIFIIC